MKKISQLQKAKKQARARRIGRTIINILLVPVFLLAILMSVSIIVASMNKTVPSFCGYSLITISSGSMKKSGFQVGDIAIIEKVNPRALKKGDIIAYYRYDVRSLTKTQTYKEFTEQDKYSKRPAFSLDYLFGIPSDKITKAADIGSTIVFHEIIDIRIDAFDRVFFQTKGTSNYSADTFYVNEGYVIGSYVENHSALLSAASYLYRNNLFAYVVLVPIIIICIALIINIMSGLYTAFLELDVINKRLKLSDPKCVKRNVGYQMGEETKLKLLAQSTPEERLDYISLLWRKAERPVEVQKHYLYQKLIYNKYQQIEDLKAECSNLLKEGTNQKVVQTYYANKRKKIDKDIEATEQRLKRMRRHFAAFYKEAKK